MTITLKLPPETEARLNATAAAQGVSVEELLKSAIELLLTASEPVSPSVISPSERAAKFVAQNYSKFFLAQKRPFDPEQWAADMKVLAQTAEEVPVLPEAALTRKSIYRERD